jgi:hypothetical protein
VEIRSQAQLRRANITQLHGRLSDETTIHLILKYAARGQRADRRALPLWLCSVISFCHHHKLGNVLTGFGGELKLADFGLSV